MKRIICISLLVFFIQPAIAQVILPKFEPAVKVERLSDESEESNIFTYNQGNNIFFYRTYVKGEGNDMEVLRQNIWFSNREGDKWAKPDRLFRMKENEVESIIIGSSEDGKKVYIFKTIYHPTEDSLERAIGMIEKNEEDDWGEFQPISIPGLTLGENYFHFHLSHDESILMISMSPTDELLDEDLFVSIKDKEGNWSEVKNLGPIINTRRVEISPFIDDDGKTLYFSSEGHGGFGGSDVFVSYRLDDSWTLWTKPKNLGEAINTREYEENFVHTRNNEYYFTSTKESSNANIYYTHSDYAVELNRGKALVMKQNMPMPTMFAVLDADGTQIDDIMTKEDGQFKYNIRENEDDIVFKTQEINAEGAFIYILDEENNKRDRMIIGKDLASVKEKDVKKDQKIVGGMELNGEPYSNGEVAVYDINNYKLGTATTDEKGVFAFETAMIDNQLKFVPKDDNAKFTSVQLYGADGNFQEHLEHSNGMVAKDKTIAEEKLAQNIKPITPPVDQAKTPVTPSKPVTANKDYTNVVYFGFNAISLEKEEERKLRSVVNYMKKNKDSKVVITGNTDAEGEDKLNMIIGKKRALYVKKVLTIEGISSERISVESKGKSNPIASNDDESGRSQNRRVEITIK